MPFGPAFGAGDVVGCGIDYTDFFISHTKLQIAAHAGTEAADPTATAAAAAARRVSTGCSVFYTLNGALEGMCAHARCTLACACTPAVACS